MATRRKVIQEDSEPNVEEFEVEEITTEVKPKWKVMSGGVTLLDKRSFSKGDEFFAYDWEVSKSIRDIVKCITPDNLQKPVRKKQKYSLKEVEATPKEQDAEGFVQMHNIANGSGKVISQKPMTKEEATVILNELNQ